MTTDMLQFDKNRLGDRYEKYLKKIKSLKEVDLSDIFYMLGNDKQPVFYLNLLSFAKCENFENTYFLFMEKVKLEVFKSGKPYICIQDVGNITTKQILFYKKKMKKLTRYNEKYYPQMMFCTYTINGSKAVMSCFRFIKSNFMPSDVANKIYIQEGNQWKDYISPYLKKGVVIPDKKIVSTQDDNFTEDDMTQLFSD